MTNTKNKNKKKKNHRKKTRSPSPNRNNNASNKDPVLDEPQQVSELESNQVQVIIIPADSPESPPNEDPNVVIQTTPEDFQRLVDEKMGLIQVNRSYDLFNPGPSSSAWCSERQLMGYVNGTGDASVPMEVDDDDGGSQAPVDADKSRNEYRGKDDEKEEKQVEKKSASRIPTTKGSYCSSDNSTTTDTATEDDSNNPSPEGPKRSLKRHVEAKKTYPPAVPKTTMASSSSQKNFVTTTTTTSLHTIPSVSIFNSKDKNSVSLLQQREEQQQINFNNLRTIIDNHNQKCAGGPECSKPASVRCPACNSFQYCTDKHKKMFSKKHEMHCSIPYRVIASTSLGNHAITAREIPKATILMTDEPLVQLPLNPEAKTGMKGSKVPKTGYCVLCFRSLDLDKTLLCECYLPKCVDSQECKMHQDKSSWAIKNEVLSIGHVECGWLKKAQEAHLREQKEALKNNVLIDLKPEPFAVDQSIIYLIRLWYIFRREEANEVMDLFKTVKSPVKSKVFLAKLSFIRKKLGLEQVGVNQDEILHTIDCGVTKFGRNFGEGVTPFVANKSEVVEKRYVKGIFKVIKPVLHSCVPNCQLYFIPGDKLSCVLVSQRPMKKGEVLTMFHDERIIYYPTWLRKHFLQSEFGITCNCKRCVSPSELDTYFSSFPCSNCPSKRKLSQGFISCSNPNDPLSSWVCSGCKRKSNALRALDLIQRVETEVHEYLADNDVFGLMQWFGKTVGLRVLHWNHFTVLFGSIGILTTLFDLVLKNDMPTISRFNKTNGLELLQAAEVVLHLSEVFHPTGYLEWMVTPLCLSAIIKLRDITNRLKSNEISLQKLEQHVTSMYFRTDGLYNSTPLYNRYDSKTFEGKCLKALELKCLFNLCSATKYINEMQKIGNVAPKFHEFVMSFYNVSVEDGVSPKGGRNPFENVLGSEVVQSKMASGLVPWVLEV